MSKTYKFWRLTIFVYPPSDGEKWFEVGRATDGSRWLTIGCVDFFWL